jgi:hypothetical protein|tara:strand:+ start:13844 stop:14890 length:1047 start_codon:yes stop_codon:yes gene_type:complete
MDDLYHIVDYDRSAISLHSNLVKEVLPEHFATDYPNLITFLEGYYDYQEADEYISILKDLAAIRDIERADAAQLDKIFLEIASGASREYFTDPREVLRNFANFYRVKGTRYSAEGFFRAFFNTTVQIEYPKNNIFIVGEPASQIGVESLKYIMNYSLYQIFSVLIKSPIPINQWRELYKKFVHPAGWFLGGATQIENTAILWGPDENPFTNRFMPDVIPADLGGLVVEGVANLTFGTHLVELAGILGDGIDYGTAPEYVSLTAKVGKYLDFTVQQLESAYGDISNVMHVSSPTLDDDSNPEFYPYVIRMDNNAETMDQSRFYTSSYDSINENFMFTGYVDSDYIFLTP